ncbi:MAG: benzoate-CoA ligase family protein, partial [SAR324 cluster bacterium]|nr:benzoate-CoA ligase family protein [SAR324 cluster bacterium]
CRLAPYRGELRHLRHVITVGGGHPGLPALEQLLAPTENEGHAPHPAELMHPDDAAFWLYTSGSTGAPKAAVHLHRDPVYAVERYAKAVLGLTPEDKGLSAARMCFAYGMGNSLFFPLATGCTGVILPAAPTGETLLKALARHRPTVFYGVPTHFRAILDQWRAWPKAGNGIQHTALGHLRFSVSAGEALPAQTATEWRETFGSEILDSMGSTEMLTFFIANHPGRSRPGNIGTPVPGFSVRLVDAGGRDVPPGKPGSLRVKGETAAARYWNRRALTRSTMLGEWIVTGDRLVQEQDGSYRYLGRDDDMFKVGGSWVSPMEVESALMTHPDVAECAVVGKLGPQGLSQAQAYVVTVPHRRAPQGCPENLSEELRQHVADRIAAFKVPETITVVPRLPRTPTGKVRRFQLRG